jgi:cyanamide hydratase
MPSSADTVATHGWTAVPSDSNAILKGRPYIHKPEPLLVKDMTFPSEDVVTKVQQYAKEKLAPQTYNHSMRVFYFCRYELSQTHRKLELTTSAATAILQQQFPEHAKSLSPATLALTCLLHDIGTTHDHLRATQLSFEFFGGILALDLVGKQLGAPQSQAEAVCEAIIRHQDLGTVGAITFLGQLIQLATIYDNMGGNPALVHADTKVDVNRAFPRDGWSRCFAATIREENGLKPWAHTTALGEEDFPNGVLNNKLMAEFE